LISDLGAVFAGLYCHALDEAAQDLDRRGAHPDVGEWTGRLVGVEPARDCLRGHSGRELGEAPLAEPVVR